MDPRETGEQTTLKLPSFNEEETANTEDTEDSDDMLREDETATIESIRPGRRRLVAGRLLNRQVVMSRITKLARGASGRRFVTLVAVLALLIAVLGIILVPNLPPQVQLATVKQEDLALHVSASGNLQSAIYDANFVGNGGKIGEIDVAVGQHVTEGQTLAKLDTTLLQDAVSEAQAAVNTAQTRVDNAQTNQSKTQNQADAEVTAAYSKEQADLKKCGTDASCKQAAEDAYAAAQARAANENASAQAQLDDAKSQLSAAQAKQQTAQDTLSGATLTSPHAGTIAAINSSLGSVVGGSASASSLGGAPFIRIADLDTLQVQAYVSVADIDSVAKGQTARFTVPSIGQSIFQGTVSTVAPLGQVVDGVLKYPATIDVDTAAVQRGHLLPGMAASATITTDQRFGVLTIPVGALTFARAAGDRKHGGFLTKTQVDTALRGSQQLALQAQDSGIDVSQATVGYVLERKKDAWVVKPVLLGITDGHVYEVLVGLSKNEKVATGEKNVLGFTTGPVAPTPTASPAPR